MHSITTLRALVAATLLCASCAVMKEVVRTIDDAAEVLCDVFAAEHPAEFEQLVRKQLAGKGDMLAAAQREGFDPRVLCVIPEVLEPFRKQAREQGESLAAAHRSEE